jgi:hypothetical protein
MPNLNLSQFTAKTFVADADHTFIWDTAGLISKRVSRNSWLSSGTITANAPITFSQTWNAGTTVMSALRLNVTDTASGATSNLLELASGATPVLKFGIDKSGAILSYSSYISDADYQRLRITPSLIASEGVGSGAQGTLTVTSSALVLRTGTVSTANRITLNSTGQVGIGLSGPTGNALSTGGRLQTLGDIEATSASGASGLILWDQFLSRWRITVSNTGVVTATAL